MIPWRVFRIAAVPVLALALAGCGDSAPAVSFDAARSSPKAATIEGELQVGSVSRTTGKPTRFILLETGTGSQMPVTAPETVPVPSNITTAHSVRVTGKYNSATRQFVATEVQVHALNRNEQPRG